MRDQFEGNYSDLNYSLLNQNFVQLTKKKNDQVVNDNSFFLKKHFYFVKLWCEGAILSDDECDMTNS